MTEVNKSPTSQQPLPSDTPSPLAIPSGSGGGVLAYASDKDGGRMDLYLMNADGSDQVQITKTRDDEFAPAWSPDASSIAYLKQKNSQLGLYILDLDEALKNPGNDNGVKISQHILADSPPFWTPDGSFIIFSAYQDDVLNLYSIQPDGNNPIQLTDGESSEKYPAISPDGSMLVFSSNQSGTFDLFLVENFLIANGIGNNAIRITDAPGDEIFPSWSPDGAQIVFTSTENGNKDLVLINWDGSDVIRLTESPADEWDPEWSLNGKEYIYSYFNFNSSLNDVVINNFDHSNPSQITSDSFDNWWPTWMP